MSFQHSPREEASGLGGAPLRRVRVPATELDVRAAALGGRPALQASSVLRLQRLCGNAAVGRLVQPAGPSAAPVVQRWKYFANEKTVDTFLDDHPVDRKVHLTAPKYFNWLKTLLPKGKDRPDAKDLEVLEERSRGKFGASSGTTRKQLDAKGWTHIWRGDVGSGGGPTGFHWKGKEAEALCESDNVVTETTDSGFYHAGVRFKTPRPKSATKNVKPEGSTFFPDAWVEKDVKDAIELRNSSDQITTAKGFGTQLAKSGETIYPSI